MEEIRAMEAEHMRLIGLAKDKKADAKARQEAAEDMLRAAQAAAAAAAADVAAASGDGSAAAAFSSPPMKRAKTGGRPRGPGKKRPAAAPAAGGASADEARPAPSASAPASPPMPPVGTSARYLKGKVLAMESKQVWRIWVDAAVAAREIKLPYGSSKAASFKAALDIIKNGGRKADA